MYSTQLNVFGYIILFIALTSIVICLFALSGSMLKKNNIDAIQLKVICTFFTLGCASMAFLWDPADYYDLYHHFIYLDQIRNTDLSLGEFLTSKNNGVHPIGQYSAMISFNILRYILVKISENNHLLPGLCTLFDYIIFQYITLDWMKNHKIKHRWLLPTYLLFFSFMPYLLVVSGVRNAFAASLVAFAIYLRLCKKKNIILYSILCIIAATFHPVVVIPAILTLLYPIFKGKKGVIIIVGGIMLFKPIAKIFTILNISFLNYIGEAYLFYVEKHQYQGELLSYVVNIIVILSLFILIYNKKNRVYYENNIYDFIFVYMVFLLASTMIGSNNIMLRSAYVLGPLSIILITPCSKSKNIEIKTKRILNKNIVLMIMIVACAINALDSLWKFFAQMF